LFTHYQSLYFAHWLTLAGRIESQISRAMASARVDMNPHQVEAACFALKSPLSRGVLLADEVGLGKTIEASLVIAQKWAERKRNILLVAPASLRKQWSQELADKFELPSIILDSNIAREQKKQGLENPFKQQDKIIICSYEFVARQKNTVSSVHWNLVVFDEAHTLRNLYQKTGNKRAKDICQATQHAEAKVLLSATPIQNNLMELYGLVQVIDDHFFGDEKSFRTLYINRANDKGRLDDLKQRIQPLCHRTLRRQVQQEGGIQFTNRYSLTQDFTPSVSEWDLYQKLSAYLAQPKLHAFDPKARHLVTISIRKILASSSFAVAATLAGMIARLEKKQLLNEDTLSDLEDADDWYDQFDDDQFDDDQFNDDEVSQSLHYTTNLQQEIIALKEYQTLAANIASNAKGDALLLVLEKAFAMTENLGGPHKAVIFTESCRTQQYLKKLLDENGHAGRVVLLNGSNTDADSKKIYQEWLHANAGSARVSGSKSADMKAALVDKFKSKAADILISTEAGGEGINLQFCALLINYDLPWNPQKVEQRIGRVHRYGQLNDVVVVNFVNRKNPADRRVFELLSEKFKLFEGVFGASDEILGVIEGNIDIEKRIYEIFQKCRTDDEIEYAFNKLQQDMEPMLSVREENARKTLLNHFDRDVVLTLKSRRDQSNDFLDNYQQVLMDLARAELPSAQFGRNHFEYNGNRFDLSWVQAQKNNSDFFRLQSTEHMLAWDLLHKAKARKPEGEVMPPAQLAFSYNKLDGHYAALQPYIGQSGILKVVKLSFAYAETREEHLLVMALTDAGERLTAEDAEHLLRVPATIIKSLSALDVSALQAIQETLESEKAAQTEAQLNVFFEQENTKLERWAEDRRQALFLTVEELDRAIKELKRDARQLDSLADKLVAKRQLKQKERERDDALNDYNQAKKHIEQQEDKLLDEIYEKLETTHKVEELFTVRWILNE
jgi:SNF2 family DNA or RNA helicase